MIKDVSTDEHYLIYTFSIITAFVEFNLTIMTINCIQKRFFFFKHRQTLSSQDSLRKSCIHFASPINALNSAGINDPEGPEKLNNTEVKYGRLFTAATRHLTPAVVKYKNLETK
jgi:hypothetical protein